MGAVGRPPATGLAALREALRQAVRDGDDALVGIAEEAIIRLEQHIGPLEDYAVRIGRIWEKLAARGPRGRP
jgi:hypothetical protein